MEYRPHELPTWDTSGLFTDLSVPVMTCLRQPDRQVLDTMVDAGSLGQVRGAELALRCEVRCSAGRAIERCSGARHGGRRMEQTEGGIT